jgi:phosphohistidine phosphatase
MTTLLLLRHAKSSWDDPALGDFDRPLTERGRKAARRMGEIVAERSLLPDLVVCSPARRARETCDRAVAAFGRPVEVRSEDRLYLASPQTLLEIARALPDSAARAMLIGHNPGLERFARGLAGSAEGDNLQRLETKFPTAALAVLEFGGHRWHNLKAGGARLTEFLTPRGVVED